MKCALCTSLAVAALLGQFQPIFPSPFVAAANPDALAFKRPFPTTHRGGSSVEGLSPDNKPINFHKNKPAVPPPKATLAALEATVTDEFIANTIEQVALSSNYSSSIIIKYKPDRAWLWSRWHGTVLQSSLPKVALNTGITLLVGIALRQACGSTWSVGMVPDAECVIIARLKAVDKLFHYLQSFVTFILTFFLGKSFDLWREMYKVGRGIQGKMSDIGILLATHAKRHSQTGPLTDDAKAFLSTVARRLRLFHILTWASQSRQFQVLLTNRGMTQLMQRGFLSNSELDALLQLPLPPTQRQNAVLEWIILDCNQARRSGVIDDTGAYFKMLLQKICELRGTASSISDLVDGRMPLAYAHLVQLLVDSFLFAAPMALFSELGMWAVLCVAFMTLFYAGLLDLAKIFLDPLNNEDYCEGGVDMDLGVFIRESNAGSMRWMQGLEVLPN